MMKKSLFILASFLLNVSLCQAASPQAHNIILFVPDGLRADIVSKERAPTMASLRDHGVNFTNSHSLFPTFTTPNASALATGHLLGDTGNFGNTIYAGFAVKSAKDSVTPFIENDAVLTDIDEHFVGNYLNEESILAAARKAGYATAAIGKLGPVAIQDLTANNQTIIIDDSTGREGGIALSAAIQAKLQALGLPVQTPARGDNGKAGDKEKPGTQVANVEQQQYFVDVTSKVILPTFKEANQPFVLVFWSRDPDGTQHNQGDSLGAVTPGINGPTSMAAIRNADDNLSALVQTLQALGLDKTTNILVAADHGFSTISKESETSSSANISYSDVSSGKLPAGFLAMDLAIGLDMPLYDPDAKNALVDIKAGQHPKRANGLIGANAELPDVVVAANGGSDLIYLPQGNAKELALKVVDLLLAQDYVSGVFVDDDLGNIAGTLPMSSIGFKGSAITPQPAIVVNFRSYDTGCKVVTVCAAVVADSNLQQGQGMHGSFSRADTKNFMAAIGPDFKQRFKNLAPASNADIGMTMAHLLQLNIPNKGELQGRVLSESLKGGKAVKWQSQLLTSPPASNGLSTILNQQFVGKLPYFDAAGFAGRTVGLKTETAAKKK
ncbi:alkaline phosphatase family protein [Methyloradius palustris]|uniref:Nucleotide pyrophosphatase n=1 Tax=Methyloradius palustris TaxID=2778876 RepID=A0A8E4DH63_9PROT|nr:alkaline phosphatase family protein [Methyloradius palustris]BCM26226.1 nucleotide pyrophosphatase [Methyloradius palustris]